MKVAAWCTGDVADVDSDHGGGVDSGMPVFPCSGPGCERLISVSAIPGGNPTALAEPEKWAIVHRRCGGCSKRYCDRCVAKDATLSVGKCLNCGSALEAPPGDEAMKMMMGGAPATGAVASTTITPPSSAPNTKKPWWKFW